MSKEKKRFVYVFCLVLVLFFNYYMGNFIREFDWLFYELFI